MPEVKDLKDIPTTPENPAPAPAAAVAEKTSTLWWAKAKSKLNTIAVFVALVLIGLAGIFGFRAGAEFGFNHGFPAGVEYGQIQAAEKAVLPEFPDIITTSYGDFKKEDFVIDSGGNGVAVRKTGSLWWQKLTVVVRTPTGEVYTHHEA